MGMSREEAKDIFLNRGYIKVEGCRGEIFHPDKWREACIVISEWLKEEPSYNSVKSKLDQEPKATNFDILRFVADNAGLSTFEAIEKAYNMGVSEQEQVLDKIRAEIKQLRLHKAQFITNDGKVCIDSQAALQIIDKYREEVNHRKARDRRIEEMGRMLGENE